MDSETFTKLRGSTLSYISPKVFSRSGRAACAIRQWVCHLHLISFKEVFQLGSSGSNQRKSIKPAQILRPQIKYPQTTACIRQTSGNSKSRTPDPCEIRRSEIKISVGELGFGLLPNQIKKTPVVQTETPRIEPPLFLQWILDLTA